MSMRKAISFSLVLLCLVCLCGCRGQSSASPSRSDTLSFSHATLLRVERNDSFTVADVYDAWHPGRVLHRYLLVPRQAPLPSRLPEGTLLRTPLRRTVAFSSVHGSLLCDLGQLGAICGVCDFSYVQQPEIRQAVAAGRMADMGSSMQPDVEKIVAAGADALLVSPFENAGYGNIAHAGIPLVECADYMESSALGRAEWVRFFGLLFGCEAQADSLFKEVEANYQNLSREALRQTRKPRLLCDQKSGAAWYVPGGGSTLGRLFQDAGADYTFSRRSESGSISLSFETVYEEAHNADVWLIKYGGSADLTYASLASDFKPYTQFRPWQERKVYGCNTLQVPYYEETPFHPDRLLKDLVKILHPQLLPDYRLRYYQPLK